MKPNPTARLAEIDEQLKKLKARRNDLQQIVKTKERKKLHRRWCIIGRVVEGYSKKKPDRGIWLMTLIENADLNDSEREVVGLPPREKKDPETTDSAPASVQST